MVVRLEERARAFTGTGRKYRSVDQCEFVLVKEIANGLNDRVPNAQDGMLAFAAKPQVSVVHQEISSVLLGRDGVVIGSAKHLQARHAKLKFISPFGVRAHHASQLKRGLLGELACQLKRFLANVVLADDALHDPHAVAELQEMHRFPRPTIVKPALHGDAGSRVSFEFGNAHFHIGGIMLGQSGPPKGGCYILQPERRLRAWPAGPSVGELQMGALAHTSVVSIVTRPEFFSYVVTGPERKSWLQGLLTADLSHVAPGLGAWSLALTKQGKIVADLWLLENSEGELWIGGTESSAGAFGRYLEAFLIMEDAEFRDASAEYVWQLAAGDGAISQVSPLAQQGVAWGAMPAVEQSVVAWVLPRTDELRSPAASDEVVEFVSSAEAWLRLRITLGIPLLGVDFSADDNPHQVSLERRAINWHKGCYLGQEVVCMQEMRGKVKRRLVRLRLETANPPAIGALVLAPDGSKAGELTSTVADGATTLAFARLKAPYFDGSVPLSVGGASAQLIGSANDPFAADPA